MVGASRGGRDGCQVERSDGHGQSSPHAEQPTPTLTGAWPDDGPSAPPGPGAGRERARPARRPTPQRSCCPIGGQRSSPDREKLPISGASPYAPEGIRTPDLRFRSLPRPFAGVRLRRGYRSAGPSSASPSSSECACVRSDALPQTLLRRSVQYLEETDTRAAESSGAVHAPA